MLNRFKTLMKAIEKAQMKRAIELVKQYMLQKRVYRETYNELSKLSDAELKDIGIVRGNIHEIAMNAYFKSANVN